MWFIGVEVEQETSAPPPKKNPGSAPGTRVVLGNGMRNIVFRDPEGHQVKECNPEKKKSCDCYHWIYPRTKFDSDCSEKLAASFF